MNVKQDIMIGIKGLGQYIPKEKVAIEELVPELEPHQFERIGLKYSLKESNLSATDMSIIASKEAIVNAGIDPSEIDLIISCQASVADFLIWQTSGKIQHETKAHNAAFFDLYQGCSGFIAALRIAQNTLLADTNTNNIMICTGEKWENIIANRFVGGYLFSDGGSAAIVTKNCNQNIIKGIGTVSRGDLNNMSKMQSGQINGLHVGDFHYNITNENPQGIEELKKINIANYQNAAKKALLSSGLTYRDIDWIILPNGRLDFTDKLINALNIDKEKTNYKYIAETGDVSTADAMINYQRLIEDESIKPGENVLILAQGAGMTWAACIIQA